MQGFNAMMLAAGRLDLPAGAAWGFSAVGPVHPGQVLPASIQAAALRRQQGFAAGRRAAIRALEGAGYPAPEPAAIGADGLPVWPPHWYGSITHTDDWAAALVAPDCPLIGVDLEPLMPPQLAFEVAEAIMPESPPGHAGMPSEQEVSRVFSGKEALYKALFPQTRQFEEFSAASVSWGPVDAITGLKPMCLKLTKDWSAEWRAGAELRVQQVISAGHVLSLVWCKGAHRGANIEKA